MHSLKEDGAINIKTKIKKPSLNKISQYQSNLLQNKKMGEVTISREEMSKFVALKYLYRELQRHQPTYDAHICRQTGFVAVLGETTIAHGGDGEYNLLLGKANAKVKQ